jgi:hypothetical protein
MPNLNVVSPQSNLPNFDKSCMIAEGCKMPGTRHGEKYTH